MVASAEKLSTWKNRLVFEDVTPNRYKLKKEPVWGNAFVIGGEGVGRVGSVRKKGLFKREWAAELPEELPLEARVFIVLLVFFLWKRAASAAAAGGAAGAAG